MGEHHKPDPDREEDPTTEPMKFDTKVAVIVREDLATWQALNVTAFTVSGIAGTQDVIGMPYQDGSGVEYLPMIKQPILVFSGNAVQLQDGFERARGRDVVMSIYTDELFSTPNDDENRAAVRAVPTDELCLAGMAVYGKRRLVDRVLKGLALHQ